MPDTIAEPNVERPFENFINGHVGSGKSSLEVDPCNLPRHRGAAHHTVVQQSGCQIWETVSATTIFGALAHWYLGFNFLRLMRGGLSTSSDQEQRD
jgi:hypothetical protein